jgi:hypothetical protein
VAFATMDLSARQSSYTCSRILSYSSRLPAPRQEAGNLRWLQQPKAPHPLWLSWLHNFPSALQHLPVRTAAPLSALLC